MMLQLDPPIPVETPQGKAMAVGWLDYGAKHHLLWICFIDKTGECWSYPNPEIRAQSNPNMGRVYNETFLGEPWKIKS